MANSEGSSNSVAIVALIVVGVLIAGGATVYFGGLGGGDTHTVIERQEAAPKEQEAAPKEEDSSGYSFKHKNEDGTTIEIEAPN